MTPKEIKQWKSLVNVARWGSLEDKRTVIVELDLLMAVDKLLEVPGWANEKQPDVEISKLEKEWDV